MLATNGIVALDLNEGTALSLVAEMIGFGVEQRHQHIILFYLYVLPDGIDLPRRFVLAIRYGSSLGNGFWEAETKRLGNRHLIPEYPSTQYKLVTDVDFSMMNRCISAVLPGAKCVWAPPQNKIQSVRIYNW